MKPTKEELEQAQKQIAKDLKEYAKASGFGGGFAVYSITGEGGAFYTRGSQPTLSETELSFPINLGSSKNLYAHVKSKLIEKINQLYPESNTCKFSEAFWKEWRNGAYSWQAAIEAAVQETGTDPRIAAEIAEKTYQNRGPLENTY